VESIRFAVDRLLAATSPEQQTMLTARLEEMERSTAQLVAQAPTLGRGIAPARQSLRDSAASAANLARQADSMRRNLDQRNRLATGTGTTELRSSLAAARDATAVLNRRLQSGQASLAAARDATAVLNRRLQSGQASVQAFSQSAVGTRQKIREARQGAAAVQEPVEQVERGGLGALSGPPTPDYQPKSRR
jgi:chromosome segregation ATPase